MVGLVKIGLLGATVPFGWYQDEALGGFGPPRAILSPQGDKGGSPLGPMTY